MKWSPPGALGGDIVTALSVGLPSPQLAPVRCLLTWRRGERRERRGRRGEGRGGREDGREGRLLSMCALHNCSEFEVLYLWGR